MIYFDKIFHLLTGGLEFLEISAKLMPDIQLEHLEPSFSKFAKHNKINIFVVKKMPKILFGKDIYIKYIPATHGILVKALHSYYDGVSIARFFIEIDKLYRGEELNTIFNFKTPINNYYGNKAIEIGANIIMNKVNESYEENKLIKPYAVYKDLSSGDLIRKIHKDSDLDMIMLVSKSKLDNEADVPEMKNNLTFRYVKKGEDFKYVLKNSSNLEQTLRFAKWLAKRHQVLFFNNLSNLPLPSFIERLVCNEETKSSPNSKLLTLVAYPRNANGEIEVYKA